nr:unnamed protein product [Callosobruchus analis]
MPHFPGKTSKQISDKRCLLGLTKPVDGQATSGRATAVSRSLDDSTQQLPLDLTINNVLRPQVTVPKPDMEEERNWRQCMLASAARTFAKHRQSLAKDAAIDSLAVEVCSIADALRTAEDIASASDLHKPKLDSIVDELTAILAGNKPPPSSNGRRGNIPNARRKPRGNRDRMRRQQYATVQSLWAKDPKLLATMVAEDTLADIEKRRQPELPKGDQVRGLYDQLWGVAGTTTFPLDWDQTVEARAGVVDVNPIQLGIVENRYRRLKPRTAAGPDGVDKKDIRPTARILLTILYNVLLGIGFYPTSWKRNRTTLIPKDGKDLTVAANWRPITVSSILARLFSGVLDESLRRNVELNRAQKGFTRDDGAAQNVSLFRQALKSMKEGKGGTCSILDISKAFDTVPHDALVPALRRLGVAPYIADYVKNAYQDCKTVIPSNDDPIQIGLKRGVKQGDPLSPLLWNAVVDPLLTYLDPRENKGIALGGRKVSVLAFADDLILLSDTVEDAERDIKLVAEYFSALGMTLSIAKCSAFNIKPLHKTWAVANPYLNIDGQEVGYVEPDEALRYLGVSFTPWKGGVSDKYTVKGFVSAANRVAGLSLKPEQKLKLLFEYVYPRYRYGMVLNPPSKTALVEADQQIRNVVRKFFHLPESTTSHLIYTRKREGGLGVPRMEVDIQLAVIKSVVKMRTSKDEVVKNIGRASVRAAEAEKAAKLLRVTMPSSVKEVDKLKQAAISKEFQLWKALPCQGDGIEEFKNRQSNEWLCADGYLSSGRMVDALRMRTNTYGNRTTLIRAGHAHLSPLCRVCGDRPESLSHIVGGCPALKPRVIKRHDEIGNLVIAEVSKKRRNAELLRESTIHASEGMLKPDLIVVDRERVQVVDFTVRYEGTGKLEEAYMEKVAKYSELSTPLLNIFGDKQFEVIPIVVGARGALPIASIRGLRRLGIYTSRSVKPSR